MHCSKRITGYSDRRLLDHLVGDCEYARREGDTERLGDLEIDQQLELG